MYKLFAYEQATFELPKPLFQSEAKCETIDMSMKMIFYSQAHGIHFHTKDLHLALCWKVRVFGSRKWHIVLE